MNSENNPAAPCERETADPLDRRAMTTGRAYTHEIF